MSKYHSEWRELEGHEDAPYFYVRPKVFVDDFDWIKLFSDSYDGYGRTVGPMLVDVSHADEQIGPEGFRGIIEALRERGVEQVRLALLPSNQFYPELLKLLDKLANTSGLNFTGRIVTSRVEAEDWLRSTH